MSFWNWGMYVLAFDKQYHVTDVQTDLKFQNHLMSVSFHRQGKQFFFSFFQLKIALVFKFDSVDVVIPNAHLNGIAQTHQ